MYIIKNMYCFNNGDIVYRLKIFHVFSLIIEINK